MRRALGHHYSQEFQINEKAVAIKKPTKLREKCYRFKRPDYKAHLDKLFKAEKSLSYKSTPIGYNSQYQPFGHKDSCIKDDYDSKNVWQIEGRLTRNFQSDLEAACIQEAVNAS